MSALRCNRIMLRKAYGRTLPHAPVAIGTDSPSITSVEAQPLPSVSSLGSDLSETVKEIAELIKTVVPDELGTWRAILRFTSLI